MASYQSDLNAQYGSPGLGAEILRALESAGKNLNSLTLEDLHPLDEFHSMGLKATRELAAMANISAADKVLDLGCGIGGPARTLAREFGSTVTGLDPIADYIDAATMLTKLVGLNETVSFRPGEATALPFDDNSFEVVWSQHVSMNVPDKAAMFGEIARVLKSGGRYAFQEVCSGTTGDVRYPVPWANRADISFLVSPEELNGILEQAGLKLLEQKDVTAEAHDWFRRIIARGSPPLSIVLLMGANTPEKLRNLAANYEQNSILMLQAVCRLR